MTRTVVLLVLAGCSQTLEPSLDEAPSCEVVVDRTVPDQGAAAVYHRDAIEFHLSGPDDTARVVADIPGQTVVTDDHVVVFTPDEPLAPSTPYEVTLEYCGGAPSLSFTTSAIGEPLETSEESLIGRAYALYTTTGHVVQSEFLAEMLSWAIDDTLLVGVVDAGDGELVWRVARATIADPLVQDTTARTVDLPAVLLDGPYFSLRGADVVVPFEDQEIRIFDLDAEGTFSADASTIEGIRFSGVFDGRDLLEVIDVEGVDEACDLAEWMGMPCEACPTDGERYCMTVEAAALRAERIYTTLQEVDEATETE